MLSLVAEGRSSADVSVRQRTLLERQSTANGENVWKGRPISSIVLAEPLHVRDGARVPVIDLIPPVHQHVYRMGLEHLGADTGDQVDDFSPRHRETLTGQQFQSPEAESYCNLFEDFTHVPLSSVPGFVIDRAGDAWCRPERAKGRTQS